MCLFFVPFCVTVMASALKPGCSKSSSLEDVSTQINPMMSPNQGDGFPSPHYNEGSSHSSMNRPFSQSSSHSSASPIQPSPQNHPRLQPPCPIRPTHPPGHRGTNGLRVPCPSSSIHLTIDSSSKSKGIASSHSQSKKAPTKPMWVDVSVLPRIPKIKRESSGITNDGSNRSSSISANGSNSATSSNGYGMPETGMNSFAGDKGRQQSVDQQKGRADGQTQRPRPDAAGSSSSFSNSFSSSSAGSPANQPCYSSSSSSSSAVSFRINSSGNSWHSRRLSIGSSSASGGSMQEPWREKEDEARKRQVHRDKQMLLASHTLVNKEQDSNTIYDPFNPTLSDSSSSDEEAESTSPDDSSRHATHDRKAPSLGNKCLVQSKKHLFVKTETQEIEISEEEPRRASAQETISQQVRCSEEYVKVEKESRLVDTETEKRTSLLDTKVKKEPGVQNAEEAERFGDDIKSFKSETGDTTLCVHHSLDLVKTERETLEEVNTSAGTPNTALSNCRNDSSASSSVPTKKKQKAETKSDSKPCSKSPSRDLGRTKKAFQASKERRSSSPETDRSRRGDQHTSGQGDRQKEKKKDIKASSRRSRSRERRRARSTSESSQSNSPDRTRRKRRRFRSRSRSKDRRRSR